MLENVQVKEVAETLDIHPFMLSRWRKEYREGKLIADKRLKITPMSKDIKELDRVKKLEQENARLRQENDLLKKWQRFSRGGTSERFGFIKKHGQDLGVSYLCDWLNVSRSGYYAWLKTHCIITHY